MQNSSAKLMKNPYNHDNRPQSTLYLNRPRMPDNRAVNLALFMAWLIVVLHMLIAEEAILFPVTVKHIALNKY